MNRIIKIIIFCTLFVIAVTAAQRGHAGSTDREALELKEEYVKEGTRLYEAGDYSGSLDAFTKAHAIDPWNEEINRLIKRSLEKLKEIDAILYEGFRLIEESKPDEAYELFKALKNRTGTKDKELSVLIDEGLQEADKIRRAAYRAEYEERAQEGGEEYLDPQRQARIAALKERIVKEERKRLAAEVKDRARTLFDSGELDRSKEEWKLLLELVPGDEEAYSYLSMIDEEQQRRRKAIEAAEAVFEDGVRLYRLGEYEEAKQRFEKAVEMDHRTDEARGFIERIDGLIAQRLKKEKELRKLQEDLRAEAKKLFNEGEYARSRPVWERLLGLLPGDREASLYLSKIDFFVTENERLKKLAESYFTSGTRLFSDERYREAVEQFENAIAMSYRIEESRDYIEKIENIFSEREKEEQRKKIARVAQLLREGIKYYNLNDFKRSLSVLNEGLELDPENSQIKEYILRDIVALKREEETQVRDTSPFFPLIENLNRLGTESFNTGVYEDAVKYFEQILLIFPFNEQARLNLARALSKTDPSLMQDILGSMYAEAVSLAERGSKREAEAKFSLLLEVDPNYKDARRRRNELTAKEKETVTVVTEADVRRARELHMYALGLYRSEQIGEAVKIWRQAVELDPEFVDARVYLARAETQLHNLERAATSLGFGTDLRIDIKRHYLDGIHLFMEGLYAEAITEWEEVLRIDPAYENAKRNIARAKQRLEFENEREAI
jgi:tetratricopeptide (TPR) repeat protein